ncbi:MAG: zinc-binding dehydrogenase [Streptosporangiales bacterium]|nr:zinc-binding dehydrogenase [Streptosporangiales bacterium]
MGAGPIGLVHLAAARAHVPACVIVSARSPHRRREASARGADVVVDPAADDLAEVAAAHSAGGRGADVVVVAVPVAAAQRERSRWPLPAVASASSRACRGRRRRSSSTPTWSTTRSCSSPGPAATPSRTAPRRSTSSSRDGSTRPRSSADGTLSPRWAPRSPPRGPGGR